MTRNELEVRELTDDLFIKVVVTHYDGVGVIGMLNNLCRCENTSRRVNPHLATSVTQTLQRILCKDAERSGTRCNLKRAIQDRH